MLTKTYGTRIDRAIAAGRVLLAVFGTVAVWLDPTQPARFQEFTYGLLTAYSIFAMFVLGLTLLRPLLSEATGLFAFLVDLTVFSAVMYLTEGTTSPFFVFFTFALLVATLRWGWPGVLSTAAASLVVLGALGWWAAIIAEDPGFELNRFIVRCVYLAVAGLLLAYLAAEQERIRMLIAKIAAPLPYVGGNAGWPIGEELGFAADALNARRVLLAWTEADEPWQQLALWNDGELTQRSEPPARFDPLVAGDLEASSFFSADTSGSTAVMVHGGDGRFHRWTGLPVNAALCREFSIVQMVSVPVPATVLRARLFMLDRKAYSADDVQLAELAAARIGGRLEQHGLLKRLSFAAADAERLRIARDIHDGTLQFLAGTGLHLQAAASLIATDRKAATRRIAELQRALSSEQAQLRALVERLRERDAPLPPSTPKQTLGQLIEHLERQWELAITFRIDPPDGMLDDEIFQEMTHLLAEAIANARRHGRAASVDVSVSIRWDGLVITIADDGAGLPIHGRFDLAAQRSKGVGPRSLRERVVALGGNLIIESQEGGCRIHIDMPIRHGPHSLSTQT